MSRALQTRIRREPLVGYTLMEVLIALALLSVLIGIIASLMSVFGRAEQTAQRTAIQLQTLRTVRRQLTADLGRLTALAEPQSDVAVSSDEPPTSDSTNSSLGDVTDNSIQPNTPFAASSNLVAQGSTFLGTPFGFRCQIELDQDAAMWLESWVARSEQQTAVETNSAIGSSASMRGSAGNGLARRDSPERTLDRTSESSSVGNTMFSRSADSIHNFQTTAQQARLEYRLTPDPNSSGMGYRLQRTLSPQDPPSAPALVGNQRDPNAVLDTTDLYRVDPISSLGETRSSDISRLSATHTASHVANALFRYSDGLNWYRNWNGASRGGAPIAIEITFDLSDPNRAALKNSDVAIGAGTTSSATGSIDLQDLLLNPSETDETEVFDPFELQQSTEEAERPDTEMAARETEVRWIIRVNSSATAPRATLGSEGADSSRSDSSPSALAPSRTRGAE